MLVVRPPAEGMHAGAPDLTKILVPLDGSGLAASVLPFAADLAKSLAASLVLFHGAVEPVMTYPGSEAIFDATARLEIETGARKFLTSAAIDLTAQGLKSDILTNSWGCWSGFLRRASMTIMLHYVLRVENLAHFEDDSGPDEIAVFHRSVHPRSDRCVCVAASGIDSVCAAKARCRTTAHSWRFRPTTKEYQRADGA